MLFRQLASSVTRACWSVNTIAPAPTKQIKSSIIATQTRGLKLMPKNTKSAKNFKGRVNLNPVNQYVVNGEYGIVAAEPGRIKGNYIYSVVFCAVLCYIIYIYIYRTL